MEEREYEPFLVTVAITTHNRSALLQRALAGALTQTYRRLEVLVSDDASTDDTSQLMAGVRDPRFRYLRIDKPTGIAGNFQNALDHARGELFSFSMMTTNLSLRQSKGSQAVSGIRPPAICQTRFF